MTKLSLLSKLLLVKSSSDVEYVSANAHFVVRTLLM